MLQAPVVGVAGGHADVLVDARVGLGGDDLGQDVDAGESLQFDGAGPLLAGFAVRAVDLRAMPAESRLIPIIRAGLIAFRAGVPVQTGGGDHRRPTICGMLPEPVMLVFEAPVDDVVRQLRGVGRPYRPPTRTAPIPPPCRPRRRPHMRSPAPFPSVMLSYPPAMRRTDVRFRAQADNAPKAHPRPHSPPRNGQGGQSWRRTGTETTTRPQAGRTEASSTKRRDRARTTTWSSAATWRAWTRPPTGRPSRSGRRRSPPTTGASCAAAPPGACACSHGRAPSRRRRPTTSSTSCSTTRASGCAAPPPTATI